MKSLIIPSMRRDLGLHLLKMMNGLVMTMMIGRILGIQRVVTLTKIVKRIY
jgi:hypothetical protein